MYTNVHTHRRAHIHMLIHRRAHTQTDTFSLTQNVVKMLDAGSCIVLPIKDFYLEKYTNPSNCENFYHSSLSPDDVSCNAQLHVYVLTNIQTVARAHTHKLPMEEPTLIHKPGI